MKYKDFLEYLETNIEGYKVFMGKAMQFQNEKNAKRPAAKRWENPKMEKAAYEMWKTSMQSLYNNLNHEIKSDLEQSWINFIEHNNIIETVNDGINDLNFGDEVA